MNDKTVPKQSAWWVQGQSGNPTGRPRGSRNKLGEAFLSDLLQDWKKEGKLVIEQVRKGHPAVYLRTVASLLPRQLELQGNAFDGLTDDQLAAILAYAQEMVGIHQDNETGTNATEH